MIWFLALIISFAPSYLFRFNVAFLPTTLLEVLIVGFLFLTIIRIVKNGSLKTSATAIKKLGLLNYAIILFVLAGIISTAVSPEPIKALGLFRAFILEPVLMFYAIILTIKSKQDLNLILQCLFWFVVGVSAFGLFQYQTFIHLPMNFWGFGEEPRRIVSIFAHPNALSLYLAPLFGFFAAIWLNTSVLKHRWLSAAGLVIIFLALILTYSRGAWLGVAVGGLYLLIKKYGFKKILAPTLVVIVLTLAVPSIQSRLALGISDSSSSAHFDLMKIGADKILHNPLIGNGLFGFRTTQSQAGYMGEIHNYPHNLYLSLWVELGLLGLISFAWILNLAFKHYKPDPAKFAVVVFLVIMLVHGLVDTPYFKNDLALLFWFMLSIFYI